MTGPTITPFRVDAERALLGILMQAPALASSSGVMPGDLCPEMGHPEILGAIVSLYETKGVVDPILLSQELIRRDQLTRVGEADHRGGVYLFDLVQAGQAPGSVGFYARIVREATVRRRLHEIGSQLVRTATTQGDLDVVLDNASELALSLGLVVDTPIEGNAPIAGLSPIEEFAGLSPIEEFVGEPSPEYNWVIPGILEHQDRVVLVADEGAGKSVLARQLCTLLAAGRHPFMPSQKIRPRRTLLVDLENPPDLVRRGLRGLVEKVHEDGLDLGDRAWRWSKPEGMDLRSQADRQLMTRVIELTRPDFVAIGPLYKASRARPNDTYEVAAAELASVFDHFRSRYGCALWIEHHMPKGDAAGHRSGPIGSSFWMRWPEFGPVLRWAGEDEPNVYHLKRFRGDRDERAFPDKLIKRAGRWPWTPDWDDQEARQGLFDAIDAEQADGLREAREAREATPPPPEPEPDRTEIAGSGIQRSTPWPERYTPERDETGSSTPPVSDDVSQTVQQPDQTAQDGPAGPGSVAGDPEQVLGAVEGSTERDEDGHAVPETTHPDDMEPDYDGPADPEWNFEDDPPF